ncbi:glutamate decarboxylase [Gordonibacter sp. An230]|uniref:glutamate decarboxylase n=1 Tax=Gordonibacter sp. An230 TaxID=1965592 RepID=UPI000B3A895D|nr:glutamate decarboxylase [Gordonibacter sp. An230]OUO88003.1 glutamate decarboxylase [Gordonibacter sp. An230]
MKERMSTSAILDAMDEETKYLTPIFGSEASDAQMPRTRMNDEPVEPRIVYEMVKEHLSIEGNATQNLATFCQTYMEPMAARIMSEVMAKNAIDKDEYPMTADLENRCVAMIGDLWHANPDEEPMGTSTVGSSEACMLGGLGMLFRWKKLAKDAGIDIYTEQRPNLVISAGYQVCWEKFCRYWDIEMRLVPLEKDHLSLNMDTVMDYVDDHTIGIVAILGITYTGKFDDVQKLDELVGAYNKEHSNLPIRIHVDGASGSLVAPFVDPDLVWDFQLENVWSINASGHKYGLVYPGIGWVVWRSKEALPEDLIFWVSYLGGEEATMAINFSRSASQIVGQYYVLMRNGFKGFREIHLRTLDVARYLAAELEEMGIFEMYEDASNIPIVCWGLKDDADVEWSLYDLSDRLRMSGWLVPAYPMPANLQDVVVQRVVVRQDFSMQLAIKLADDLKKGIDVLSKARIVAGDVQEAAKAGFNHGGRSSVDRGDEVQTKTKPAWK